MADKVVKSAPNESMGDFLSKIGLTNTPSGEGFSPENEAQNDPNPNPNPAPEAQQTEGEEQAEVFTPENQNTGDDDFQNVFELALDGDKKETFDVFDEEQKTKLLDYAKNWRLNEDKIKNIQTIEETAKINESQLLGAVKLMYSKELFGAMDEDNLMEKPWELYMEDAKGDKTEAMKNLKEDRAKIQRISEFTTNFNSASQKFVEAKETFQKSHPEITNVDNWLRENLNPVIEPITSYGEKPISADTFEMVYLWNNKDRIFKEMKDAIVKEVAGREPEKAPATKKNVKVPKNKSQLPPAMQEIDDALNGIGKRYEGQKILIPNII